MEDIEQLVRTGDMVGGEDAVDLTRETGQDRFLSGGKVTHDSNVGQRHCTIGTERVDRKFRHTCMSTFEKEKQVLLVQCPV